MNESCWGGRLQCSAGTKETNTSMMVMMSMMRMRMRMMNKMLWDESVRGVYEITCNLQFDYSEPGQW